MALRRRCLQAVLAFFIGLVALSAPSASASAATAASGTVVIPYLATDYRYLVVPFGAGVGFHQPGFDDSNFLVGAAGFGTPEDLGTGCGLNDPADVQTAWPLNTDILLRRSFTLLSSATWLRVDVAIDNDVQVFVNGRDISGGLRLHEGCATRGSYVFTAGPGLLRSGANLLAVRARDRGGLSYVDVRVSAETRVTTILSWQNETTGSDHGFGFAAVRVAEGRVCFGLRWTNIPTPLAAHIHKGPPGVAGDVVVPLFAGTPGPNATGRTAWGCVPADAAVAAAIAARPNDYYVNVMAEFPGGAIRGQLRSQM